MGAIDHFCVGVERLEPEQGDDAPPTAGLYGSRPVAADFVHVNEPSCVRAESVLIGGRRAAGVELAARWLFSSALTLAAGACFATGGPPNSDPFADGGRAEDIEVLVSNQNFYDATLTAISETGQRRRLGTVGGHQDAEFAMRWDFIGSLRIEISLLAGRTCTTDPILVSPGDTVELRILPQFDRSSFCG